MCQFSVGEDRGGCAQNPPNRACDFQNERRSSKSDPVHLDHNNKLTCWVDQDQESTGLKFHSPTWRKRVISGLGSVGTPRSVTPAACQSCSLPNWTHSVSWGTQSMSNRVELNRKHSFCISVVIQITLHFCILDPHKLDSLCLSRSINIHNLKTTQSLMT